MKLKSRFRLESYLKERRAEVERAIEEFFPLVGAGHSKLREAMRHSLRAGGKRLRPILALAACDAVAGAREQAIVPAAAIEFLHTYSLIHDDLPAMDDASLRRGKPACHKVYGEAMAILAGDALLTEAFAIVARWGIENRRGEMANRIAGELADAAGVKGMVSGQAFDIEENGPENSQALDEMHLLKTGALIKASVRIGAIVGEADEGRLDNLSLYARDIGLAFQITDDLLDQEGEKTGKDMGLDEQSGKKTYPSFHGMDGSRKRAKELVEKAVARLENFGEEAAPLAAIARHIIERKN